MRHRTTWLAVSLIVAALPAVAHGQPGPKRPMPPNLFSTRKLNDHLYVIAPSGPDMSNVGGNIGICISDQGVLLVDANYFLDWRNAWRRRAPAHECRHHLRPAEICTIERPSRCRAAL